MELIKAEHEKAIVARLDRQNPSIKDVGDAVKLIISKMWTEKRMDEYIEAKHNELCRVCPRANSGMSSKMVTGLVSAIGTLAAAVGALVGALAK